MHQVIPDASEPRFQVGFCSEKLLEQPQNTLNYITFLSNMQEVADEAGFGSFRTHSVIRPVLGTAADITKKALGLLPQRLANTGTRIIGTVHDKIIVEAPGGLANDAAEILKKDNDSGRKSLSVQGPG